MYAVNKLSPGPRTEVERVGDTARVDNPTKEVIPTDEDRMDETADVGTDTSQAGDMEDSKAVTTPMDGGGSVVLMRVQDRVSASIDTSTAGPMVTVCTQV